MHEDNNNTTTNNNDNFDKDDIDYTADNLFASDPDNPTTESNSNSDDGGAETYIHSAPPNPIISSDIAVPVAESDRVVSIDVLRGVALLGILVMNIQAFSMIFAAYSNPTAYGDLTGINYWVWYISHLFFDMKMMAIFSMLFGAGVVLMTSHAEKTSNKSAGVYYRRTTILLLFGLLHGYLLWIGDILVWYALTGFWLYLFRKIRPAILIPVGLIFITLASGVALMGSLQMAYFDSQKNNPELKEETRQEYQAVINDLDNNWQPSTEAITKETEAMRGSWSDEIMFRVEKVMFFQLKVYPLWGLWRVGGLMLIGMGLFKLGVFSAARSKLFYFIMFGLGWGIGLPIVAYGAMQNFEADWYCVNSKFMNSQYNYWASIPVSLGWVGLIMLLCKSNFLTSFKRMLQAVGQMALTNYLLHTLICTTIFYGRGLGCFGRAERVDQILIVLGIWIFQLLASPLWLKYYRYGPFEWLWRSLTYKQMQKLRR